MIRSLPSMGRSRVFGAVTVSLLLGGVALAGPTSGRMMVHPIDGTGSVTCAVVGGLNFSPPVRYPGAAVTETVTVHAKLTSCTGTGDGANVTGANAVVHRQLTTNDCLSVLMTPPTAPQSGPLRLHIVPGTHRLNPAMVEFDSLSVHDPGAGSTSPITLDIGGSSIGGSFSGDPIASHTVLKATHDSITKQCLGLRGLRSLPFTTGSVFSLNAPAS